MGFLSKLFGGGGDKGEATAAPSKGASSAVARWQKKVENKFGQAQDRQHAIRTLADMGTPEAVSAMLVRFTFRIEQTIGDEEEKRMVFDELLRLGDLSVEPIVKFLQTENSPYWAVKALRALVGDERTVTHLLEVIDGMEAIFDRDIERKVELVSNLREFRDERVRDRLQGFLSDENEELRVHAIEGLMGFGQEEMSANMIDRLLDDGETQRVKTAILNLVIEKKWRVKHRKDEVRKVLPAVFWMDDVGVVHRR